MARRTVLYDASDEDQVNKAQKAQADRDQDIDYILKEPRGRRWIFDLVFDQCHYDRVSHVPTDTHSTAFNEGARAVGASILSTIRERYPAKYMQMLEENSSE